MSSYVCRETKILLGRSDYVTSRDGLKDSCNYNNRLSCQEAQLTGIAAEIAMTFAGETKSSISGQCGGRSLDRGGRSGTLKSDAKTSSTFLEHPGARCPRCTINTPRNR